MSFAMGVQGAELRSVIRIKRKRLWVKRIVILEGHLLFYYKSSRDTKPRGILPLSSYSVKELGLQKGEYILELQSQTQTFGLAFPTQSEGTTWLEAIKSVKSGLKPSRSVEDSKSEVSLRSFSRERVAKQFALEQMPAPISQKLRPVLEKRYVLVSSKGTSQLFQELNEDSVRGSIDTMDTLQPLSLILVLAAFLLLGSDSLAFRAVLLVAVSLHVSPRLLHFKKAPIRETAFKAMGATSRGVSEVINVLLDVPGRGLWDPHCVEATEGDEIALVYLAAGGMRVKQTITRNSYTDKSQFFILERESQRLKYIFVLEELEPESTQVTVYGRSLEPFAAQSPNPELLSCLLLYLNSVKPKLQVERSLAVDTQSEDEEESVAAAPSVASPEQNEGYARYLSESNEALTTYLQLLEEKSGWETISTGSAQVKGSRRQTQGGLYIIRGEGVVPKPVAVVVAYLKDLSRKSEYDTMYESGHIIETFPDELEVVYQRYKKQFPASGRDLCLVQKRFDRSDGQVVAVAMSTTHPSCLENKDLVRAHLFIGGFAMTPLPDGGTNVVYMTHADLGGKLPTMIVNKVQNSQALVVEGVRRALSK